MFPYMYENMYMKYFQGLQHEMNVCVCGFVTWLVKTREAVLYMSVTAVAIPVEVV